MNQLGFNPILLLGQIINFAVLFFILHKLVFKTVLEAIDKRAKKLKQTNELIANAKKEAEKQEEIKKQKLSEARKEVAKVVKQAKEDAQKRKEEIIARAKKEAKGIIDDSKLEIAKKEEEMEKRLKSQSIQIATEIARKLIKEALDDSSQRLLINKAIKGLKKIKS